MPRGKGGPVKAFLFGVIVGLAGTAAAVFAYFTGLTGCGG